MGPVKTKIHGPIIVCREKGKHKGAEASPHNALPWRVATPTEPGASGPHFRML